MSDVVFVGRAEQLTTEQWLKRASARQSFASHVKEGEYVLEAEGDQSDEYAEYSEPVFIRD